MSSIKIRCTTFKTPNLKQLGIRNKQKINTNKLSVFSFCLMLIITIYPFGLTSFSPITQIKDLKLIECQNWFKSQ